VIVFYYLVNYETLTQLLPLHNRKLFSAIFFGDLTMVGSFTERLEIWEQSLDLYFYDNYLFGFGPLKGVTGSVFDNQYIKWLVWYGLFGTMIYVLFISVLFLTVFKISKRSVGDQRRISYSITVMYIVLCLSCITGAFFDNTQLLFFLMMLTGSLYRSFSDGLSYSNSINLYSREFRR
jgi:O-antigen ligase